MARPRPSGTECPDSCPIRPCNERNPASTALAGFTDSALTPRLPPSARREHPSSATTDRPLRRLQTTIGTRYVTIVKTAAAVSTIRKIHLDHLKIIILSLNE